ncbi:MAG: 30S ribosomal protein S13 [Thermoplasmatales archaeon]|nr:30S ribosomal protein S13 [Thermoplasmatales archaeon]
MAPQKKEKNVKEDEDFNFIVRIAMTDIDGQKKTVVGLQSIKGVGERVAYAIVKRSGIDQSLRIGSLPEDDVRKLEELVQSYADYAPNWALNRQMDYESGVDTHYLGTELTIVQDEDVNRMKMIRSYRGIRHETKKKVRGQRTRSNGRRGLTLGVSRR